MDNVYIGVDVGINNLVAISALRENDKFFSTKLPLMDWDILKKKNRKEQIEEFEKLGDIVAKRILELIKQFKLNNPTVVLEDLRSIWDKDRRQYLLFGKIHESICNMGELNNVRVTFISPAYTSQICFNCEEIGIREQGSEKFFCNYCNVTINADINASLNIAKRGQGKDLQVLKVKYNTPIIKGVSKRTIEARIISKLRKDTNGCLNVNIPKSLNKYFDTNSIYEINIERVEEVYDKYNKIVIVQKK